MQSAYRQFHFIENVLLFIQNDLLVPFDTVNRSILLHRLSVWHGIRDNAHAWLKYYLTGRRLFITVKCEWSGGTRMTVMSHREQYYAWTSMRIIYCFLSCWHFGRHGVSFYIYADNAHIYFSSCHESEDTVLAKREQCLKEVRRWMAANWLQLNDSKTEFVILESRNHLSTLK